MSKDNFFTLDVFSEFHKDGECDFCDTQATTSNLYIAGDSYYVCNECNDKIATKLLDAGNTLKQIVKSNKDENVPPLVEDLLEVKTNRPWIYRVIVELYELNSKLSKLIAFIKKDNPHMEKRQKDLLVNQSIAMQEYADILYCRLAFEDIGKDLFNSKEFIDALECIIKE